MDIPPFINALLLPHAYPHPVDSVRLIETHISWVLLAGEFAYKIKKPVDFGFLDFSTLDRRKFCCEEEIRLNGRLAPEYYLDVVTITGTAVHPHMGGALPVLDYAVRMRAFPADATLDRETDVTPSQIDAIADRVAQFHGDIEIAPDESDFGSPEVVMYPVGENFRQIRERQPTEAQLVLLAKLETWSRGEFERLHSFFNRRKQDGYIRECHGDLHLGNIAWVEDSPVIFDCIEFNPNLRFVDVISEVAFTWMDLTARGHEPLAWRFLNRWLEVTGDYSGLAAFRFYLTYRALVRAKVCFLRAEPTDVTLLAEAQHYLELAARCLTPARSNLWLMHGVSGSGKSWLSQQLLENPGAIRLRSDVERKRLFGLNATDRSDAIEGGIYGPEASQRTFDTLAELATVLLKSEFTVIVDATFLKAPQRRAFIKLACAQSRDYRVISLVTPHHILRQRVAARTQRGNDASEATLTVLDAQLANQHPLSADELKHACEFERDRPYAWQKLQKCLSS